MSLWPTLIWMSPMGCFLSAELRCGKQENKMKSISNDSYGTLWLKGQPTFSSHGTKEWWSNLALTNSTSVHTSAISKGFLVLLQWSQFPSPTHRHLLLPQAQEATVHHPLCSDASSFRQKEQKSSPTSSAKSRNYMDFLGGPVAKTLHSQCRGPRFDPRSGN